MPLPRFTILEHTCEGDVHWDLILEQPVAGRLPTWRISGLPTDLGHICRAQRVFDHRRVYLEYEGEISGGRGVVCRWDCGTFTELENRDGFLTIMLAGTRIAGRVRLDTSISDESGV